MAFSKQLPVISRSITCMWSKWTDLLALPVGDSSVVFFRIWFGLLMAIEAFNYHLPRAQSHYSLADYHFTYPGFDFVVPWPSGFMELAIVVQGIAGLGVMLGIAYRVSAVVLFLTYTHLFLIDEVNYNNHYYLYCLLCFFMIFISCDGSFSLGAVLRKNKPRGVCPFWNVFIIRAHLAIAYFYGGLTKLNGDWLRGEPMHKFLLNNASSSELLQLADSPIVFLSFAYAGLAFDLAVPLLLLFRRTRVIAIPLIIGFNVTNHFIFTIGTFPWFMLGSTVIFFPPDSVRRLVRRLKGKSDDALSWSPMIIYSPSSLFHKNVLGIVLATYLLVQTVLPFRHHFQTGYTDWTKLGQKFSWRMKSNSTDAVLRYLVKDGNGSVAVIKTPDLNRKQALYIADEPRMIASYARVLRARLEQHGYRDFEIRVHSIASLNGRPYQFLIDPNVDVSRVDYTLFAPKDWIVRLKENQQIGLYPRSGQERLGQIQEVLNEIE